MRKFLWGKLVRAQVAIEFTKPPGREIHGSMSRIIKERPRYTMLKGFLEEVNAFIKLFTLHCSLTPAY